jgi:hypothetical protein
LGFGQLKLREGRREEEREDKERPNNEMRERKNRKERERRVGRKKGSEGGGKCMKRGQQDQEGNKAD